MFCRGAVFLSFFFCEEGLPPQRKSRTRQFALRTQTAEIAQRNKKDGITTK
jgi:hypothetical protein